MNRILAVPNWSHASETINREVTERLTDLRLLVHYAKGDFDHGRCVTAFSGEQTDVLRGMEILAEYFFPKIDLQVQSGVHPKAGALDVAPYVLLEGSNDELIDGVSNWAKSFSERHQIPGFFYEQSSPSRQKLPVLRGQTSASIPNFDFGQIPHPRHGYFITGVRDFLLAVNIDFPGEELRTVQQLAKEIRALRDSSESIFTGVRALAFQLKSRGECQLSMNLTNPDLVSFDAIYDWVCERIGEPNQTELIGVIRPQDIAKSTRLTIDPRQIVS